MFGAWWFCCYWCLVWGIKNGEAMLIQWITDFGTAVVQDILVFIPFVVIIFKTATVIKIEPQMRHCYDVLKGIAELRFKKTKTEKEEAGVRAGDGEDKDIGHVRSSSSPSLNTENISSSDRGKNGADDVVDSDVFKFDHHFRATQHISAACRVAQILAGQSSDGKYLSSAKFLLSIDDADACDLRCRKKHYFSYTMFMLIFVPLLWLMSGLIFELFVEFFVPIMWSAFTIANFIFYHQAYALFVAFYVVVGLLIFAWFHGFTYSGYVVTYVQDKYFSIKADELNLQDCSQGPKCVVVAVVRKGDDGSLGFAVEENSSTNYVHITELKPELELVSISDEFGEFHGSLLFGDRIVGIDNTETRTWTISAVLDALGNIPANSSFRLDLERVDFAKLFNEEQASKNKSAQSNDVVVGSMELQEGLKPPDSATVKLTTERGSFFNYFNHQHDSEEPTYCTITAVVRKKTLTGLGLRVAKDVTTSFVHITEFDPDIELVSISDEFGNFSANSGGSLQVGDRIVGIDYTNTRKWTIADVIKRLETVPENLSIRLDLERVVDNSSKRNPEKHQQGILGGATDDLDALLGDDSPGEFTREVMGRPSKEDYLSKQYSNSFFSDL